VSGPLRERHEDLVQPASTTTIRFARVLRRARLARPDRELASAALEHGADRRMLAALEPLLGELAPDAALATAEPIGRSPERWRRTGERAGGAHRGRHALVRSRRCPGAHAADDHLSALLRVLRHGRANLHRSRSAGASRWWAIVMVASRCAASRLHAPTGAARRARRAQRRVPLLTAHRAGNVDDPSACARSWTRRRCRAGVLRCCDARPGRCRLVGELEQIDGLRLAEPRLVEFSALLCQARAVLTDPEASRRSVTLPVPASRCARHGVGRDGRGKRVRLTRARARGARSEPPRERRRCTATGRQPALRAGDRLAVKDARSACVRWACLGYWVRTIAETRRDRRLSAALAVRLRRRGQRCDVLPGRADAAELGAPAADDELDASCCDARAHTRELAAARRAAGSTAS